MRVVHRQTDRQTDSMTTFFYPPQTDEKIKALNSEVADLKNRVLTALVFTCMHANVCMHTTVAHACWASPRKGLDLNP